MPPSARRILPAVLTVAIGATTAHGQYLKSHGVSISVGGFGQFSRALDADQINGTDTYAITPGNTTSVTVFPYRQDPTNSFGGVATLMIHPVPWAGLAFNYSFTHFDENIQYYTSATSNYNTPTPTMTTQHVPTDVHEYTGGYLFHPKKIPFQPYVEVGGGYLDFRGRDGEADSQFRGAGLLETGFDLPVHSEHIGFRVAGRSLYYRAPNYDSIVLRTRTWRVTMEPTVSAFYRF